MKVSGKKYGFNIIAAEYLDTVVGLWDTTKNFVAAKDLTNKTPLLPLFGGDSFNGNHYW